MSIAVSVVVPLFNGAKTIQRALDSVLEQGDGIEIIVIDDCSTDGGPDMVDCRSDGATRLVRMEKNGGPAAARNRGIAEAAGDWIGLLDADDVWMPGRLKHFWPIMDRCDVVADGLIGYDSTAACFTGAFFDRIFPGPIGFEEVLGKKRGSVAFDSGYLKPLFRRSFVDRHKISYDTSIRQGEDWLFYVELALLGARFELIDYLGYGYTTWVGGISGARSLTSHTRPNGAALAEAVHRLAARRQGEVDPVDRAALTDSAMAIQAEAGAWDFHDAVLRRNIGGIIASLLRHPSARHAAGEKIMTRFLSKKQGKPA